MPTLSLQRVKTPYDILLARVRNTLVEGQRRVEEAKVRTYWETGQYIGKHILKYADRAEYGGQVINRLAKDLKLHRITLHACVKFAKIYPVFPIVYGRKQFKWSHFRELIAISDEKVREQLEDEIQRNAWTSDELIARIKEQHFSSSSKIAGKARAADDPHKLLTPLRGELYHYKIIRRPDVSTKGDNGLRLDLGFRNFEKLFGPTAVQFKEGDIVRSVPVKDINDRSQRAGSFRYKFEKKEGAADSILYTYEVKVERVIDGDTLKIWFDQGFNFERTEILRLRGIDCPEINTKAGVAAKNFVLSYIKQAQNIIIHSTRDDKYGRYLADVFVIPRGVKNEKLPVEKSEDIYLNNLLLQTGHAVRM